MTRKTPQWMIDAGFPDDFAVKFWRMVTVGKADECWIWKGKRHPFGYGKFSISGKSGYAHRMARQLVFGPINKSTLVCHQCDNPPCCNPSHLWNGTSADNNKDMADKKRNQRGEDHHSHVLTAKEVLEIRAAYPPRPTMRELASRYNVDAATIEKIIARKVWKHI